MNWQTLFKAYVRLRNEMSKIEGARGTVSGIAVLQDEYALEWQRRKRQADRIEERIIPRDENGVRIWE